MSRKRFAHFLVSGKLALGTMCLPASGVLGGMGIEDSASASSLVTQSQLHIVELAQGSALEVHNTYPTGMYGSGDETQVTQAATLNIPGPECTYSAARTMDVVITGVKPGDTVYVVMGAALDDPSLKAIIGDNFRIGNEGLKLLANFSSNFQTVSNGSELTGSFTPDLSGTFSSVKLKVDVADLASYAGEEAYIQVIAIPAEAGPTDWASARFSEVDTIMISEDDCSGAYGGGGGAY